MKVLSINSNTNHVSFSARKINPKILTTAVPTALAADALHLSNSNSEDNRFIPLLNQLSDSLKPAQIKRDKAFWEFNTNSSSKSKQAYENAQNEYHELWQNQEMYDKFSAINISKLSKDNAKLLSEIIDSYEKELKSGKELQELRGIENEVMNKYNSYVYKMGDKKVSGAQIRGILETEKDPVVREQAYIADINKGDFLAEDIRELVKQRNEFARKYGYENYYDYVLEKEYKVDSKDLDRLMENIYSGMRDIIAKYYNKRNVELREIFGVNQLSNHHYRFIEPSNPENDVDEIMRGKDIVDMSKKIYKKMGYDIDELEKSGILTLDLYPRENKNSHALCWPIEAPIDVRVLTNLSNSLKSFITLNHEFGHAIYYLGISPELQYMNQTYASEAFDESIAHVMQDLIINESALDDVVPKDILQKFKDFGKIKTLDFVMRMLKYTEFERDMYRNPEQDLIKLWQEKSLKYQCQDVLDNYWATTLHYIIVPGYCQNYFRAALMQAQVYNHLRSVLGELSQNSCTGEYMREHIFSYGSKLCDKELIKQLTGKELSVDDFIKIYT